MGSPPRAGSSERGSATVLLVAVLAVTMVAVGAVLAAAGARVGSVRAASAADAAALAGAAAVVGLVPGGPCAAAARVARANGTDLVACAVRGAVVWVVVSVAAGPVTLHRSAVAGPAPVPPEAHDRASSRWASPPLCVWCGCRPAGHRCPGRPGRVRVPGPTAPSIKESRARHEEARDRREPREGEDDRAIPR
ncbi:Rv3654c family TadE-like protein [Curtobacterium sp. 9128]|uniref:Rv3654c family TadE-like protein n=1 Tax=Curtobacterium sp. 9128 TaxID=1793722 RepID=UPI0011A9CF02